MTNSLACAVLVIRYRALIEQARKLTGIYAVIVGVATVAGGDQRLLGPSYSTAVALAQNVHTSPALLWGVIAVIGGVLALLPFWKVSQCGLYVISGWSLALGLSFLWSVNTHPLAGMSAVCAHWFIFGMTLGLLTVRAVDKPLRKMSLESLT